MEGLNLIAFATYHFDVFVASIIIEITKGGVPINDIYNIIARTN